MAKFFFIQHQNVEILSKNGNPRGGAVVETLVWMKSLHHHGHEIFQAKFEEDDREVKEEFSWIKMVPIYNSKKFKKRMVWFTYRFPKLLLSLKKLKLNYLYTSLPTWHTFYIGLICKILGIKHIIRIANDKNVNFDLDNTLNLIDRKLIHLSYLLSDLIVAQSEFQYQELLKKYSNKNVEKLSNPIELNKNYLNVKSSPFGYIAWVANFRHQKNLKLLFEIASICPNEKFKIAGQPLVPMDEETKEYVEKLKYLNNVEFVGIVSQTNILDFLSEAKYLLSTSRYEGFSNTFLEAMTVGLPIITTNTVNPDGIIHKHNLGVLYGDAKDFKHKLMNVKNKEYLIFSQNCINYVTLFHDHLLIGKNLIEYVNKKNHNSL